MDNKIKAIDDNGKEINIGDYVIDYYNLADGIDSRGDGVDYMHITCKEELVHLCDSRDSNGNIVEKISKKEYKKRKNYKLS